MCTNGASLKKKKNTLNLSIKVCNLSFQSSSASWGLIWGSIRTAPAGCKVSSDNPVPLAVLIQKPDEANKRIFTAVSRLWIGPTERKREKDPLVLAFASLSYGINGGLMGYERMFYWKQ